MVCKECNRYEIVMDINASDRKKVIGNGKS